MVLMAYDGAETLGDRFSHARQCLIEMAPNARRPGKTYQGYAKATKRLPPGTLDQLQAHLRKEHQRTARNEEAFGCAGRDKTGPQLGVTTLYPMRWGVEVFFRSYKQTLEQRKMRSDAPEQALRECQAGLLALLLLGLIGRRGDDRPRRGSAGLERGGHPTDRPRRHAYAQAMASAWRPSCVLLATPYSTLQP